jgi:dolichol kinase
VGSTEPEDKLADLVSRSAGPQVGRRLFHGTLGVLFAGAIHLAPSREVALVVLLALLAGQLALDIVRLTFTRVNVLFFWLLRPFVTPREHHKVASSTWYVLGIALVVGLFPREIAVPAVLTLALADPSASYLGRRLGRRRLGTGSLLGTGVFVVVAFAAMVGFVGPWRALVAAVVTAGAEVIPWPFDDNVTVPLTAGAVMWITGVLPALS